MLDKLEKRKIEIEKEIADLFRQQQEFSRKSTQSQIEIIEKRGELKTIEKMIEELKKGENNKE